MSPPGEAERRPSAEAPPAVIKVHQTTSTEGNSTVNDGLERPITKAAADWWAQNALLAIQQLARSNRGFTAEHVLDMVGPPSDHHYVGAVFAIAQRKTDRRNSRCHPRARLQAPTRLVGVHIMTNSENGWGAASSTTTAKCCRRPESPPSMLELADIAPSTAATGRCSKGSESPRRHAKATAY